MKNKTKPDRQAKPLMKWQTGEFERFQQISYQFPPTFLMLCKLTGITPARIITDFTFNLAPATPVPKEREPARIHLPDYFIAHRYGEQYYSPEEIREIFRDLDAIARLFPEGDDEMIRTYGHWRDKHYTYWFKKWFNKNRLAR